MVAFLQTECFSKSHSSCVETKKVQSPFKTGIGFLEPSDISPFRFEPKYNVCEHFKENLHLKTAE